MKKTIRNTSSCTLAVLLMGSPLSAHADDSAVSTLESEPIIVFGQRQPALAIPQSTGSRLGLTPLETPASIAVVDGEELRARGDLTLQDAVTRAPGITNISDPGNGNTALAARGFSGQGSVLQLVDGIRLFPVAGTITYPTDPWIAERIDVLSGPASVLYGQGALGGAVNVIQRQPNSERLEAQGEIGYGSQDSFHAAAGVGGPIGQMFSFRIDGSYRRSDGFVDRGQSESHALSGALKFAPTDNFSVILRYDDGDQRPSRYFGTPLIDGRIDDRVRDRNFNVADAEMRYRDKRATLTATWSPIEQITISNTAYRLTSNRRWKNLESYRYNGTTGLVDRADNLGIVHDQTQYGDQGTVKVSLPVAGGITNDLVVGFDVNLVKLTYSNDFGSDAQEDSVDPFNPAPGLFFDTQGIAPRYRTRTSEYAVFAENRLKLSDQFSIIGGVRFEENRVRRWTFAYSPSNVRSETQALDKRLDNTTWRIGAVYQPTPALSLYGQYTTGVDPLGTLTTYSTGQVQFSHATGDQVEFGVKGSFLDGRGSATLAAYRIVKKGLLSQQTLTSPIEQVGQRSAKGVEAAVSIDLPAGFGIEANGTVLDADFDDFTVVTVVDNSVNPPVTQAISYNGLTPPNVAETAANLWLRWEPVTRLQTRAGLRYVGKRYSDNANQSRVPAYTVVDASLSYAVTDNVALDVRLYNVFDKDYAITAYNDEQWVLGRPRSVDVSLRARF